MRVAVIGAGMTGLVAAMRLARKGHEVDVYERWPGLGGQVATLTVGDGDRLERYYHHLFTTDVQIQDLYDDLAMEDEIEWFPSSVAVFAEGASHPFTTPLDLLRFRPLSLSARVRMGLAVLALQLRHREVGPFESITAREWIEAQMGAQAWSVVWGPLLKGKFGSRAEDISMAWIWSKLTLRRRIEGKGARGEFLGYPRGGWEPVLNRLAGDVQGHGGRILIDTPAVEIDKAADRFAVGFGAPDSFRRGHDPRRFDLAGREVYDAVLATTPNDVVRALLSRDLEQAIGPEYLARLDSIEYHAALCLLLELDREFSPFYWTNIASTDLPFVGLIEQTNLVPASRYGGKRFLYVANYLEQDHPLLEAEMEEVISLYEDGLRKVNPEFDRSWIQQSWLFREPAAQPIVTPGYRERMPPLDTGVDGLVVANTTQIYPEDRGTNYSVRLADEAVATLLGGE